jgi:hypothetical protein
LEINGRLEVLLRLLGVAERESSPNLRFNEETAPEWTASIAAATGSAGAGASAGPGSTATGAALHPSAAND